MHVKDPIKVPFYAPFSTFNNRMRALLKLCRKFDPLVTLHSFPYLFLQRKSVMFRKNLTEMFLFLNWTGVTHHTPLPVVGILFRACARVHESGNAMDAPQRDEPGAQRSTLATAIGVKADAWGHGKLGGLLSGKLGDNRYLVRVTPAIRRRATALCTEYMP